MIVPVSDHQVRCIPWVQMGTFNKEIGFLCWLKFFALNIFVGNTYNRVCIWCCKYGKNLYCERCANKKWCASKHTGLLNSCLGKLCLHPYLVVPLISARVIQISTRVSAHCHSILLCQCPVCNMKTCTHTIHSYSAINDVTHLNKMLASEQYFRDNPVVIHVILR